MRKLESIIGTYLAQPILIFFMTIILLPFIGIATMLRVISDYSGKGLTLLRK